MRKLLKANKPECSNPTPSHNQHSRSTDYRAAWIPTQRPYSYRTEHTSGPPIQPPSEKPRRNQNKKIRDLVWLVGMGDARKAVPGEKARTEGRRCGERSMCCEDHPQCFLRSLASGVLESQLSESPSSTTEEHTTR